MKKNVIFALMAVPLIVITFFDLNNHLDIGPKDENGFTAFDHGFFGMAVKLLLVIATLYAIYSALSLIIKRTWLKASLAVVCTVALLVAGWIVSFSLYYRF